MKIAIPTKGSMVDNHFGHCDFFTVFELNDRFEVISSEKMETTKECGCKSNLAGELAAKGIKLLLAGGIGEGAVRKLNEQKIEVIAGFSGEVADVLERWKHKDYQAGFTICTEHHNCSL